MSASPLPRVDQLRPGDLWWTKAARWETVEGVDHSVWLSRVWTVETGPAYSWSVAGYDPARIIPKAHRERRRVLVREMPHGAIIAAIVAADPTDISATLVDSFHVGPGSGWEVRDRPDGGALVAVPCRSKDAARREVQRRARAHARALALDVDIS